jgi:hypothetical protein
MIVAEILMTLGLMTLGLVTAGAVLGVVYFSFGKFFGKKSK